MAEYSVLIADSSEEFCRAMAEQLDPCCRVILCSTGPEALERAGRELPTVMMTDLMLPGLDGISLIETVLSCGGRPRLLVSSGYVSPYLLEKAERLGVEYFLEKPCSVELASRRILELLRRAAVQGDRDLRGRISGLLLRLGFSAKLRGYAYLREAIFEMVLDSDRAIVKELYAQVGVRFGIPGKLVEHSIRCAVREAWEDRDRSLWAIYFGPEQRFRPTSAALIHALAESLQLYMPSGEARASGEN